MKYANLPISLLILLLLIPLGCSPDPEPVISKEFNIVESNEKEPIFEISHSSGVEYIDMQVKITDPGFPEIKSLSCAISESHISDTDLYSAFNNKTDEGEYKLRLEKLNPLTTYYIKVRFHREDGKYIYSNEIEVKTKTYEKPKAHISSVDVSHNSATVNCVIDDPGYLNYSGYIIALGNKSDFTLDEALEKISPLSWSTKPGSEFSGNFKNLKPETLYYARIFLKWSTYYEDNILIPSESFKFQTLSAPLPDLDVSIDYHNCKRSDSSNVKIGDRPITYQHSVTVKIRAKVTSETKDYDFKGCSYLFSFNDWGNYSPTKIVKSDGKVEFELITTLSWISNSRSDSGGPSYTLKAIVRRGNKVFESISQTPSTYEYFYYEPL